MKESNADLAPTASISVRPDGVEGTVRTGAMIPSLGHCFKPGLPEKFIGCEQI